MRKERQGLKNFTLKSAGNLKVFIGNKTSQLIKVGHVAMMRATPPRSNQYRSRTLSGPTTTKKKKLLIFL